MKYFIFIFIFTLFFSCTKKEKKKKIVNTKHVKLDSKPITQVDSIKYKKSNAVIKSQLIKSEGGDKYLFSKIRVLSILKNDSDYKFKDTLSIIHNSWKRGMPGDEECVVYLTYRSLGNNPVQWMLLHGDGDYACECK